MNPIQLSVTGNEIALLAQPVLTAGTVGMPVEFNFDEAWETLEKTAVFQANGKTLDQIHLRNKTVVPWELLRSPGCRLRIGVYGASADGTVQIPTLWADLGVIQPGAEPGNDESASPALPVWQQLTRQIENALEEIIRYQGAIINGSGESR